MFFFVFLVWFFVFKLLFAFEKLFCLLCDFCLSAMFACVLDVFLVVFRWLLMFFCFFELLTYMFF